MSFLQRKRSFYYLSVCSLSSLALLLTGGEANAFGSYYVRHDFTIGFGAGFTPNLAFGSVNGRAFASGPIFGSNLDFNVYQESQGAIGNPLAFSISDSASASAGSSSAFAFSGASAVLSGNSLSATTLARGFANTSNGFASAFSQASIFAGQIGINPFGFISWRPLFGDSVSEYV